MVGYNFIYSWWDWLLITGITYYVCRNISEIKYDTQEEIRNNRFVYEMERWQNTPYVPPLLFFYLTNPPQSYSNNAAKAVNNRFYQTVVNYFRDRVFINAFYNSPNPQNRPDFWQVIGALDIFKTILAFSLALGWFSAVTLSSPNNWFSGWERFSIPPIFYLSMYFVMKVQAYAEMSYSTLDEILLNYFGQHDPRITWRELLQDQDRGHIVLSAWQAEREKRQRYTFIVRNMPVPEYISQYTNPSLAPYPYPSQQLPDWVDQMELYYQDKQKEWQAVPAENRPGSNNVIEFKKKTRKPS